MKLLSPKLAGACVLWRKTNSDIEVLIITRSRNLSFLPGQHAFPGGSIEPDDNHTITDNPENSKIKVALTGAIRETFEETGVLPFLIEDKEKIKGLWEELHYKRIKFSEIQSRLSLQLNFDQIFCSGPWITPPGLPQRFETYFFFIEWKNGYCEIMDIRSEEVEEKKWDTPKNILRKWHRGELSLSTPVAYILEHLEAFSIPEVFEHLFPIPWSEEDYHYFHPRAGIHVFPLPCPEETFFDRVNSVLIGGDEMLLIDPGPEEENSVIRLIFWLEHFIKLGHRIKGICLTHTHLDHAGAVKRISSHFDIPIFLMHEFIGLEEFMVNQKIEVVSDRIELADNDLPWCVFGNFTPGHTNKHVSYYEESTKTLVAGDIISSEGPVLIDPDDGGSMRAYMDSLMKLAQLKVDLLIPGHGIPWFFINGNELINRVIQHRKMREEKIIEKIKEGFSTFDELLIEVYNDIPPQRISMARQQLIAHLLDLQSRGIISDRYLPKD